MSPFTGSPPCAACRARVRTGGTAGWSGSFTTFFPKYSRPFRGEHLALSKPEALKEVLCSIDIFLGLFPRIVGSVMAFNDFDHFEKGVLCNDGGIYGLLNKGSFLGRALMKGEDEGRVIFHPDIDSDLLPKSSSLEV